MQIIFSNFFSFHENSVFCKIMWENIVEPDRLHMTVLYAACALHAGQDKNTDPHIV